MYPIILCGQTFADKKYYLIDSLDLDKVTTKDKKLIDSALFMFHKAKHDTLKISAINTIVEEAFEDDIWIKYNKWMYYYTQKQLKNPLLVTNKKIKLSLLKSKSDALNNMGLAYFSQGKLSKASEFYHKSLKISEEIIYKLGIASCLHNIAFLYENQGITTKAIEYYFKSLKMSEAINDRKLIGTTLNNLGIVYRNQGETSKALEFYHRSLNISEEIGNTYEIAHSINNIAMLYYLEEEYSKSLEYYHRSLNTWEDLGYKKGIAHSLNRIGSIFITQNQTDKAIKYFQNSLSIWYEIGNKKGISNTLCSIGETYLNQNEMNKAKFYANKSMNVAQEIGFPLAINNAAKLLSEIFQKENNWKKAFEAQNLYVTMRDSIRSDITEKNAIKQQAQYEVEKREQEIELLSTKNEMQKLKLNKDRLVITIFSITSVLGLFVIILIFKAYKNKQETNKLLQKRHEEKSALLKEIHHRVKNNLQIVNSLLRMQSRETDDEKVFSVFEEAQKRVLSMALLHERMYRTDDLQYIDLQEHFELLINNLIKSYAVDKNINLNLSIKKIKLGMRTMVPLSLIINEMITNSLKYAFKDRIEGSINVSLKHADNNNNYELIIEDDGVGFKGVKESIGLGTKLIQIFTKQLKGVLNKTNSSGTTFKLQFEDLGS